MTKYWFKPKRYGYGFFPISWEGWLSTVALIGLIFLSGCANGFLSGHEPSVEDTMRFLLDILILAALATIFFEKKMKEPLQWRWGKKR